MHELSIATSIVEIAIEYATKNNAVIIKEVELEVGELSGVVVDALEFAFESVAKGTIVMDAKVIIHCVRGKAKCNSCNCEFNSSSIFEICPTCNTYNSEVLTGKELRVKSLTIE